MRSVIFSFEVLKSSYINGIKKSYIQHLFFLGRGHFPLYRIQNGSDKLSRIHVKKWLVHKSHLSFGSAILKWFIFAVCHGDLSSMKRIFFCRIDMWFPVFIYIIYLQILEQPVFKILLYMIMKNLPYLKVGCSS